SQATYLRDGEHVARTSKWMGESDFYPHAENAIISARPKKIVDLGSGTCGLLMRCLRQLPEAHGVGIDLNKDACSKARSILKNEGMDKRISVIEAPIQSLIQNPEPLEGADIIHGGFVFHDLMPEEEATLDALFQTFHKWAPRGTVVIVDAVPYAHNPGEDAFSAALTFMHSHFMARQFPTEDGWKTKLFQAGYNSVEVGQLGISGGRIFTARSV
ncbi:MAG TPA: class I SAM-dependent methyltransferase, partial [Verrucomicrobiae bacterium]|nr:class I SAM-dependent methyltransferase [Verrucomicrobiae bacterium]